MFKIASNNNKSVGVKSIKRVALILKCLNNGINSITDIANACNLSKSTVHRLLKALEDASFVFQDLNNKEYYLGHLVAELTTNPRATHEYLIKCAERDMHRLNEETGETVSLGVLLGHAYHSLLSLPSKNELRVIEERKTFTDINLGASGKILLSQLDSQGLKEALNYLFSGSKDKIILSEKRKIIAQIRGIRKKGYAISYGERIPGVICLSAPVSGYLYPVSISLFGPDSRIRSKIYSLLNGLTDCATRISKILHAQPLK